MDVMVDVNYCISMQNFFEQCGAVLENGISRYIAILKTLRAEGIREGALAEMTDVYMAAAEELSGKFKSLADHASAALDDYSACVIREDAENCARGYPGVMR